MDFEKEQKEFNATAGKPIEVKLSNGKIVYVPAPSLGLMRYISEKVQETQKVIDPKMLEKLKEKVKTKEDIAEMLATISSNVLKKMNKEMEEMPIVIQLIVDGKKPGVAKDHALSIEEIENELNVFDLANILDTYLRQVDMSNFFKKLRSLV